MSSVAARHPKIVAGLIYLDSAQHQYAIFDPTVSDLSMDSAIARRGLDRMFDLQNDPAAWRALLSEIQARLPHLESELRETAEQLQGAPNAPVQPQSSVDMAGNKIIANPRPYGPVSAPILAIAASPRRCGQNCGNPVIQKIMVRETALLDYFQAQNPQARVVRLPQASHFVWRSHEAEVYRAMTDFMDGLPRP